MNLLFILLLVGNLIFKLRIAFWIFFLKFGDERNETLSKNKPPLVDALSFCFFNEVEIIDRLYLVITMYCQVFPKTCFNFQNGAQNELSFPKCERFPGCKNVALTIFFQT